MLAAGTLIGNHAVAQQSVIGNQVPQPPLKTQEQQEQPSEMDVFEPAGPPLESTLPEIFRYGPLDIRPHLDYRFFYGNGIQNAPGFAQNSIVQEVSPGILLDIGPNWALNYTPTLRFYSSNEFQNGVDQNVVLTGGVSYEDWTFGLTQTAQLTSAPLAETGGQTDLSTYLTTLSASYAFNSRVSTDLSLNQSVNQVSGFQNSWDWNTLDWLNYEFWPRLNAGLGVGAGYVLVQANNLAPTSVSNPNQTYQQLQGRVNWRATDKISLQLNGGLEARQFLASGFSSSLTPIFGLAIQYQPFERTEISVNASRSVSPSDYYLPAQETVATSVGLYLNQQLFRKFNLQAGTTYTVTDYNSQTGVAGSGSIRTDDQISFNVQLNHPFLKRGTWSIFYQYVKNDSNLPGFTFESNQVGFELNYSY